MRKCVFCKNKSSFIMHYSHFKIPISVLESKVALLQKAKDHLVAKNVETLGDWHKLDSEMKQNLDQEFVAKGDIAYEYSLSSCCCFFLA